MTDTSPSFPNLRAPGAPPWRIDGIDPRVQAKAAQAAAEANLTLPEWLTQQIEATRPARGLRPWSTAIIGFLIGTAATLAAIFVAKLPIDVAPLGPRVASAPTPAAAPARPRSEASEAPAAATPTPAPPAPTPITPAQPSEAPRPPSAAESSESARAIPPQTSAPQAAAEASATPAPTAPAQAPAPRPTPTFTTNLPPGATAPAAGTAPAPSTASAPAAPPSPADPMVELRNAAEAGDVAAQFTLASRYSAGDGVEQDWALAFKWFKAAAEQGLATSQHNLAVMYERSNGVDQDLVEALRWYKAAAEQGYPPSQFNLAVALARGWGTTPDVKGAIYWFERASEHIPQGHRALAEIFENGLGVPRDLARARTHYEALAIAGDQRANDKLRALSPAVIEREQLREIQLLLARLRYNPGPADGRPGPRTTSAIREFQRSAGLQDDGNPSGELLELLRSVAPPS
jgi:TPR repeat protein